MICILSRCMIYPSVTLGRPFVLNFVQSEEEVIRGIILILKESYLILFQEEQVESALISFQMYSGRTFVLTIVKVRKSIEKSCIDL